MAWKSLLLVKLPAISRPIVPPFTARVSSVVVRDRHLAVQVGTSKTKGIKISLQAAVYPEALAAWTLHTTTLACACVRHSPSVFGGSALYSGSRTPG